MNAWFFEIFDDAILVWGINVLLQWTLVIGAALAVGALLRRQPTIRYGVLFSGLLLVLFVPVIAFAMQRAGVGLLSVARTDETPRASMAAVWTMSPRPQWQGVPIATDAKDARSDESQGEAPTVAASAHCAIQGDSHAASANPLAPPAVTIGRLARAFVGIWLAGAVLLLVRMAIGWRRMSAILRSARPTTDEALAAAFAAASSTMRGATLAISDRVSGPIAAGLLRPCVVFPASLVGRLTPEQTNAILMHELAHLARRDPVVVLLQNAAGAIGWLHPLIVVLNRHLAQAREEVCDNHVLAAIDAPSYGRALLTLTERIQTGRPLPGAVGMFASQWTLEDRVAGLLDEARSRATRLTIRGKIVLAAFAVLLAGIAALGTIGRSAGPPVDVPATVAAVADEPGDAKAPMLVKGRIATAQGEPVGGAFVAIIGTNITKSFHERQTLAEGVADAAGRYELKLSGVSMRTHSDLRLVARADKMALAWQPIDLYEIGPRPDLKLTPERLIQVRLVDVEGKPAGNVAVELEAILPTKGKGNDRSRLECWHIDPKPKNVLPRPIIDAEGLLTVPGVPADFGVSLDLVPSDRFARQFLILNTGESEERLAHDGTYRGIVKNLPTGRIGTVSIPLAPATIFEGVVLLGDTDMPAANSRITIWASEEKGGSRISFDDKTDARGRFRLNPYAGDRFGIVAYPPEDAPYFPRRVGDLRSKPVDGSKKLEIRLPAAVMASGHVWVPWSGDLPGASVQYIPQTESNKYVTDDIVTGWQNTRKTDEKGRFKIPVLPGPGTLLVNLPGSTFALQEKSEREIEAGKPGGRRYYAHAFQSIDPPAPKTKGAPSDFAVDSIVVFYGVGGVVKLVDEGGKAIEQNIAISRLKILPHSPFFRGYSRVESGSSVEIRGVNYGKQCAVHFLDPSRRLGATATISEKDQQPTVTLKPCATAKVRLLQPDGKPVPAGSTMSLYIVVTPGAPAYDPSNPAAMLADEDLVANFDRINYGSDRTTDKDGVLSFPALIPGATYRLLDMRDGKIVVAKEFVADAGRLHDLGDIRLQSKR